MMFNRFDFPPGEYIDEVGNHHKRKYIYFYRLVGLISGFISLEALRLRVLEA